MLNIISFEERWIVLELMAEGALVLNMGQKPQIGFSEGEM